MLPTGSDKSILDNLCKKVNKLMLANCKLVESMLLIRYFKVRQLEKIKDDLKAEKQGHQAAFLRSLLYMLKMSISKRGNRWFSKLNRKLRMSLGMSWKPLRLRSRRKEIGGIQPYP